VLLYVHTCNVALRGLDQNISHYLHTQMQHIELYDFINTLYRYYYYNDDNDYYNYDYFFRAVSRTDFCKTVQLLIHTRLIYVLTSPMYTEILKRRSD